jgi:hypothetical protein
MRVIAFLATFPLLLVSLGCEPVADRAGTDATIETPDATTTDSTVPDASVPDATVPDSTLPDTTAEPGTTTDLTPDTTDSPSSLNPAVPDPDSSATEPTEPDNTAKNARDADGDTKTPLDQGSSEEDTKITAEIRQQVLEIENASVNARNVKIVTADGKVTLRGPVATAEERTQIEQIATQVAGEGNVDNQIEVDAE